jgi:hypothetical protein
VQEIPVDIMYHYVPDYKMLAFSELYESRRISVYLFTHFSLYLVHTEMSKISYYLEGSKCHGCHTHKNFLKRSNVSLEIPWNCIVKHSTGILESPWTKWTL